MEKTTVDMIELSLHGIRSLCSPYGARLAAIWLEGCQHSLVLGSETPADYLADDLQYFGAIVGPVANRIAGARVMIEGKSWKMEANEGANCLHSGSAGLHRQEWQVLERAADRVTFGIHLPHGAGGLPGARDISATYEIDGQTLALKIDARSDRPTIMNLAHHPYWNLSAEATVSDHCLEVAAATVLPTDDTTCPTGEIADVTGTLYDFTMARRVPVQETLDTNLCLASGRRDVEAFAARLSAPGGPTLEIWTTEPGLQIYNGSGLRAVPDVRMFQTSGPFSGLALEPQAWPDAPRHKTFPSIMIDADTPYWQRTSYRF